jgi:arabinogalactan oligomer/maltooligosaccharide transport system permease protein
MGVAMMINKKGIKLKKLWRTCLVMTIAVPQFISLLYVSKMFADNGIVNGFLISLGFEPMKFWATATSARIMVIILNIWIGIPHLMLMVTGILMNIPADLYESARIDGANAWKQFTKITLPYMLFITGPYLLTSFTGNMNNFNVIFLLSGGGPAMTDAAGVLGSPGKTDLLITWLFDMITTSEPAAYNLASVIGILVFVVVAGISLIVYNIIPSIKNEEDFQ